jgi:hypothetical protein
LTVEGGLAVDSTFVPLTGIPSEPSALAVLQEESGMQVLVTAADGDRVFAFGIAEPLGAPVLPGPATVADQHFRLSGLLAAQALCPSLASAAARRPLRQRTPHCHLLAPDRIVEF